MFFYATAFNQDIGSWNVSNGEQFVSEIKNEQNQNILLYYIHDCLLLVNDIIDHHLSHNHHCHLSILLVVIIFTSISIVGLHVWWCNSL